MEVFVHRSPTGWVTADMEHVAELEEYLRKGAEVKPLEDESDVHVEITGTWVEIRALLSQPCFRDSFTHD